MLQEHGPGLCSRVNRVISGRIRIFTDTQLRNGVYGGLTRVTQTGCLLRDWRCGCFRSLSFATTSAAQDDQENDDEESDQNHKDLSIAQLPALVSDRLCPFCRLVENFAGNAYMVAPSA